ncbi:rho-associated protein kinase 1-like [Physella acuta]|uniref:rho-associated protein kinase 1-like n=1 Tax=Physella acuta TaxID=109671 RepID=UPI0027DBE588|nr:rho-associated protein kinase 1-like [Physella acuta]
MDHVATSRTKTKKTPLEVISLRRDVHKYHTLYEKQKEYYEDKIEKLCELSIQYRNLEERFNVQEKEVDVLRTEKDKLLMSIQLKEKENMKKSFELDALVKNYQELSQAMQQLDRHVQFLQKGQNGVSGNADSPEGSVENPPNYYFKKISEILGKNDFLNTNNCKPELRNALNEFPSMDNVFTTAEKMLASRDKIQDTGTLNSSLQTEKDRLSRLLNNPKLQVGYAQQMINTDNNNLTTQSSESDTSEKSDSASSDGPAPGVDSNSMSEQLKKKLQLCETYLKKEKEINMVYKNKMTKLVEKLQADVKSSQVNLEKVKSEETGIKAQAEQLEKEKENLQRELHSTVSMLESQNEAIQKLLSQNNEVVSQSQNSKSQIKLLKEKNRVLEDMMQIRSLLYEDKIKQLEQSKTKKSLVSRAIQTAELNNRLNHHRNSTKSQPKKDNFSSYFQSLQHVSKYELVLRIQDLLKKLIDKSEVVTRFEKLLKQKCAILRNILVQAAQCTSCPASKEEHAPQKVQARSADSNMNKQQCTKTRDQKPPHHPSKERPQRTRENFSLKEISQALNLNPDDLSRALELHKKQEGPARPRRRRRPPHLETPVSEKQPEFISVDPELCGAGKHHDRGEAPVERPTPKAAKRCCKCPHMCNNGCMYENNSSEKISDQAQGMRVRGLKQDVLRYVQQKFGAESHLGHVVSSDQSLSNNLLKHAELFVILQERKK